MSKTAPGAHAEGKPGALQEFVEILKTVIYALAIALVLRVLLFQPFTIPSASMQPNLLEGDYIIVSKYAYGWSHHSIPFSPPLFKGRIFVHAPKRGDVIVFKLPRDGHTDYVKRLIGLPGDRIDVRGGQVILNGKPIPREELPSEKVDSGYGFVRDVQRFRETLPNGVSYITYDYGSDGEMDNVGGFVVPESHYFFMGDNRDNSQDSRAPQAFGVGYVPEENLVGRAEVILLSWKQTASIFKPWTWLLDARPSRFFHGLN